MDVVRFSFRTFCVVTFSFETGKTSVSLALAHIFGFGHTQSDNIHNKKPTPTFVRNVVDLLHKHVVIADKYVIYSISPCILTIILMIETATASNVNFFEMRLQISRSPSVSLLDRPFDDQMNNEQWTIYVMKEPQTIDGLQTCLCRRVETYQAMNAL
jgi:hypothetical protein